jgi:Zn-dependent protease
MVELYELRSRLEHYFAFSKKEVRDMLIVVIVLAFVFSFRDWGRDGQVDVLLGIWHLLLTSLIVAFSFFLHESTHRILAIKDGLRTEFKLWWGGLVASLILVFASNGYVRLALPGGVVTSVLIRQRLGEFRYGLKEYEHGIIALSGPLVNLILAFLTKIILAFVPGSWFLQQVLFFNVVFAVCSMLPIPPLDGVVTFWGGRILYVLSFFGILGGAVLVYFTGVGVAIVGGVIIMTTATIAYYLMFENKPE